MLFLNPFEILSWFLQRLPELKTTPAVVQTVPSPAPVVLAPTAPLPVIRPEPTVRQIQLQKRARAQAARAARIQRELATKRR